MREITVKLYQFDELNEEAKEKAREWLRNDDYLKGQWEFDNILEDAKNVGLDIDYLDDHNVNKGEFIESALVCAKKIMIEHDNNSETGKTVAKYRKYINSNDETERENSEHEMLYDLLEDYRVMYNKAIEFAYSNESLDEDMRLNGYEFTEKGEIA
jgi:hypothetical protein